MVETEDLARLRPLPFRFAALAGGFWSGPTRWQALALTAILGSLTAAEIALSVRFNTWLGELFDAVTQARAAAAGATSVNDKIQAENMLTATLGRLFAVAEAYPDLKANTNYLELQRELSDIENKLAAARRFFNNAVSEFNAVRRQFPTVLFAAMVGFGSDKPFFDVGESERATMNAAPPKVSFTA